MNPWDDMPTPAGWERGSYETTGSRTEDDPLVPVLPDGITGWRFVAFDGNRMVVDVGWD